MELGIKSVIGTTGLTKEQVDTMKEVIALQGDLRIDTYIALSLSTAGRISAIQTLKWDQIDFENRVIEEVLEKGRKTVEFTFSVEVKDLLLKLKEHYEEQGGSLYLRPYA